MRLRFLLFAILLPFIGNAQIILTAPSISSLANTDTGVVAIQDFTILGDLYVAGTTKLVNNLTISTAISERIGIGTTDFHNTDYQGAGQWVDKFKVYSLITEPTETGTPISGMQSYMVIDATSAMDDNPLVQYNASSNIMIVDSAAYNVGYAVAEYNKAINFTGSDTLNSLFPHYTFGWNYGVGATGYLYNFKNDFSWALNNGSCSHVYAIESVSQNQAVFEGQYVADVASIRIKAINEALVYNATVGDLFGIYSTIYNQRTGTAGLRSKADRAYGFFHQLTNTTVLDSLSETYAVYIQRPTNNGWIGDNKAIYIEDQSGISENPSYNIYSVGDTSLNYFGGDIGIGSTTLTSSDQWDQSKVFINRTIIPPVDNDGYSKSGLTVYNSPTSSTGSTDSYTIYGINSQARVPAGLTLTQNTEISGLYASARLYSAAASGATIRGIQGSAINASTTSSSLNICGLEFSAVSTKGTVAKLVGISATTSISGTANDIDAIGIEIVDFNETSSGAMTNTYGIKLPNMSKGSTLNYSIYSAGGTMYHAGNVGIGITAPIGKLHVKDTANGAIAGILSKTLTEASPVSIMDISIGANTGGSVKIVYSIEAVSGTTVEVHYGEYIVCYRNQNGTVTDEDLHAVGLENDLPNGTGIADTWAVTDGSGKITIAVTATSGLSTPTVTLKFNVFNYGAGNITLL